MIERNLFSTEHEIFRAQVARIMEREVVSFHDQWEKDGQISRETWNKAGETGLLCPTVPQDYGGAGADFLYSVIEHVSAQPGQDSVSIPTSSRSTSSTTAVNPRSRLGCPRWCQGKRLALSRLRNLAREATFKAYGRRRFATATTLSSTAQRRSSRMVTMLTLSCWSRRPVLRTERRASHWFWLRAPVRAFVGDETLRRSV